MTTDFCYEKELAAAAEAWVKDGLASPDVVLIAGSGVGGDFGHTLCEPRALSSVLPFEASGIAGHALSMELLAAPAASMSGEVVVLCYRGRLHAYQGFTAHQVVFPIRLAALLGAKVAVVTNASGGLYDGVEAGHLALIQDHINFTGLNPLRGQVPESWGPQFPDMSDAYDVDLRKVARLHAERLGISLVDATYLGVLGPCYETPAEIRAFQSMGAGLVGMSTVLEVIAAKHMGMRCLGLSLVTNPAAGMGSEALDHHDVLEIGRNTVSKVQRLVGAVLQDEAVL